MVAYVNGKRFTVYDQDTKGSIIQRIASQNNTKAIYVSTTPVNFDPNDKKLNITATFLSDTLEDIDFTAIDTELLKDWPNVDDREAELLWIHLHKGTIPKDLPISERRELSKQYTDYSIDLQNDIKKQRANVNTFVKEAKSLANIETPDYTNFDVDQIVVSSQIDILSPNKNDITIMNIFNNFKTSTQIPFVSIVYDEKRYYKVKQDAHIDVAWVTDAMQNQESNTISFRVLRSFARKKVYTTVLWVSTNSIIYSYGKREGTKSKEVIDTILKSVVGLKFHKSTEKSISIKGSFSFPLFTINRFLFLDMIMNDPFISNFLIVKERNPPKKGKQLKELATMKQRFYIYYWPKDVDNFESTFTFTLTESEDALIVRLFRINNMEQVKEFQNTLSKILGVYLSRKDSVIDYYRKYIDGLDKKIGLAKSKKGTVKKTKLLLNKLREKRPELFVKNYSSVCDPKFQPTIITEEEAKNYDDDRKMIYPQPDGDIYVCDPLDPKSKHVYPGLVRNKKLINKDEEPYLPCCYKENQKNKGAYKEYTAGSKAPKRKESGTGHVSGRNKVTDVYRYSKLPFNIGQLFSLIYKENIDDRILRFGVPQTNNSFIHCLEEALNPKYSIIPYSQSITYVENLRKSFADLPLQLGKQEMYNYSLEDIKNRILNENEEFDPKLFVRLMAYRYDCNIFMFYFARKKKDENEKSSIDGELLLPANSGVYLSPHLSIKRSIVIVVNPEGYCEVVGDVKKIGTQYIKRFIFDDVNTIRFLIGVQYGETTVHEVVRDTFITEKSILSKYRPTQYDFISTATAQYIDDKGKVRLLELSNGIYLETSPLPPFELPIIESVSGVPSVDYSVAIEFVRSYSFDIVGVSSTGLLVKRKDLPFGFIITNPPPNDITLPEYYRDPLRTENYSLVKLYRYMERVSYYLQEYTKYIYSLNPSKFSEESFVVIKNHRYAKFDRYFNINNGTFTQNNRIIVTKNNLVDRLMYYLNTYSRNQPDKLASYKNMKLVPLSFTSIYDFKMFSNEIVFMNQLSLIVWLKNKQIAFNCVRNLQKPKLKQPYYYMNYTLFKNNIVLIQNVQNGELNRALNVSAIWQQKKYNIGYYASGINQNDISYTVFSCDGGKTVSGSTVSKAHVIKYTNTDIYAAVLFI